MADFLDTPLTVQHTGSTSEQRAKWERPELKRLDADEAKGGADNPSGDGITGFS